MPKPMAQVLGWPNKPIGWSDILALAKDPKGWARYGKPYGAFKLGKTNPNFSTSGLNATIGAYFAATQRSSDLTAKDLADPKVVAYVKAVEGSVVHYGDTTLTFLSNLQKADDRGQGLSYVSAVTVEEKSVWDYNQGNPTGDPKTLGRHRKPRTPLVAIYPKEGTLFSDNPFVTLKADWVTDAKRAVAADFLSYVQSAKAQKRFTDAAFRDFEGKPGPIINPSEGLLPGEPKAVIGPPAPAVLAAVKDSWEKLRKRARVLLVLDVSGSMGDPVGSAGTTKLELAKKAAASAVAQLAPDDLLSLWIFSTQQDGQKPYRQLVPFGPARVNLAPVQAKIRDLQPDGGTGSTQRCARPARPCRVRPAADQRHRRADRWSQRVPRRQQHRRLVDALDAEDIDRAVRVFPIAYGEDADLGELTKIADASRAAAYDASDPASIDKVLTAVLSNF